MMVPSVDLLEMVQNVKIEIVIALFVIYIVRLTLSRKSRRPDIPGPYPWPVLGNVISLGDQPQYSMQKMAKKYGPVYLMKLGSADVLVLNDYDTIKEALGRQKLVFEGRPQFNSFANISQGKGVVFNSPQTQGRNWRKLKTAIVRHLHKFTTAPETRDQLSDHVRKESIELLLNLRSLCQKSANGIVDPETTINVSVANIVCAFTFGHRYNYDNKDFQDLVRYNREFGDVVGAGSQVDVMPWIKIFPSFKKSIKMFDFLTDRLNAWMKERTTEHRSTYTHGVTRDLVDTFIHEGIENPKGLLKDDIIMALTTDIFGAANDTLSTALQWVFVYMIHFPKVQKKIQEELYEVFGDHQLPHMSGSDSLPYTTAVLHEIFRHSSFTSTTLPHTTLSDTTLNGFKIPKDMLVFINQYAANHDSLYWEKPDEFVPERFLDGNKLVPNAKNKYLLFSYGSRKCPGDQLSISILLQMTACILHLAELQSDPEKPITLEAVYNLSMRPKQLRTKVHIRRPSLLDQCVTTLTELSPHIATVEPQPDFLGSDNKPDDFHLSLNVSSNQNSVKNPGCTDTKLPHHTIPSFHPEGGNKSVSSPMLFCDGLTCDARFHIAQPQAKSFSRR